MEAPGWEGFYEISRCGAIRSVAMRRGARPGRIMKVHPDQKGYPTVFLSRNGRRSTVKVHRLVCMAFVGPNPGAGYQVNHKDLDKTNHDPANLEWVTAAENTLHALANGAVGGASGTRNPGCKLDWRSVALIRSSSLSSREMGKRLGVTYQAVLSVRSGRTWSDPSSDPCGGSVPGGPGCTCDPSF